MLRQEPLFTKKIYFRNSTSLTLLSFWEKQSFESYDFIIVGAGITGLSTAISLKEHNRKSTVAIIERGILPTGASTKNAGFACFGSPSELLADIEEYGKELAKEIVIKRWRGLEMLRERLGDVNLQYENNGGYELIRPEEQKIIDKLPELNSWLWDIFEKEVFTEKPEIVESFGFSKKYFSSAVFNPFEGQLHTGALMKSLIDYAHLLGISIYTGTEVTKWEELNNEVEVSCRSDKHEMTFKTPHLAICTNAFTKELVPSAALVPGRGVILVTEQIPDLSFKGTFHFDQGFYYFRDIESRVLFGGGRNLDFEAEETDQFGINKEIEDHLTELLHSTILQQKVEIATKWSGIMAFGTTKEPIVQKLSSRIAIGVKMGGMGVAIGTMVGKELSSLLLSED